MNELSLFEPEEKWYTIEDLASLCGYASGNALLANPNTNELLKQFNNSKDIRLGGYHNLKKYYSENVLKALKEYQHNNSSPNAVIKKTDYIESHAEQYTLEQLSYLTGLGRDRLNQLLPELCNQLQNSFKFGGYHNTQKFYSENVLKALKQYQISNSAPNAVKNKEAAVTGNVSFVANEARAQTVAAILADPTALLELVAQSSKKLIEKEEENKILKEKNELLMHTSKTYTASEIAKEAGFKSAVELNKILELKEIQYKRNGTWLPTSKYSGRGYYELKQTVLDNGMVVYDSRFTQSGREFILNLFKGA